MKAKRVFVFLLFSTEHSNSQLGNFGVVHINENESWVTTSGGTSQGTQYGADGRVYAARIKWNKPNKSWNKQ